MAIKPTKNKTPSPSFLLHPEELQLLKLIFGNIGKDVIKLDASQIIITNVKLFIYFNKHPSD